ncbi:ArsR/SmtB family transcription factor [Brevibacterium ihuae]|uniref:ArsR/SmtB family transcription factor n=1 Tax=Brevibacterium ihuae TaxID=1631743 RepID=UPI000C762F2F|nr:winged helix-turn-helix domain-containing protein [Brevibacterium ihuae]
MNDPETPGSVAPGQPAEAELADRLSALEAQVASLVEALSAGELPASAERPADGGAAGPLAPHRLPVPGGTAESSPDDAAPRPRTGGGVDPFFALNGLKESLGDLGGVVFAGYLRRADGGRVDWQYGRPADHIEAADFADSAAALAALASPVRLALLQAVYHGASSVADLVDSGDFGTTGQIYHHVNQLAAAGWLESPRRGRWIVPVERMIPLLTIIVATQG